MKSFLFLFLSSFLILPSSAFADEQLYWCQGSDYLPGIHARTPPNPFVFTLVVKTSNLASDITRFNQWINKNFPVSPGRTRQAAECTSWISDYASTVEEGVAYVKQEISKAASPGDKHFIFTKKANSFEELRNSSNAATSSTDTGQSGNSQQRGSAVDALIRGLSTNNGGASDGPQNGGVVYRCDDGKGTIHYFTSASRAEGERLCRLKRQSP